jgi:hypothetical protein
VSVAIRIVIHLLIVAVVLIAPPFVYDLVEYSRFRDIYILQYSGVIGYPLYLSYWMIKISEKRSVNTVKRRSTTAKVVLLLLFWGAVIILINGIILMLSLLMPGPVGMPRLGQEEGHKDRPAAVVMVMQPKGAAESSSIDFVA